MRTKDELFREALRHIAARRQQAVTAAERDRAAALAAHLGSRFFRSFGALVSG